MHELRQRAERLVLALALMVRRVRDRLIGLARALAERGRRVPVGALRRPFRRIGRLRLRLPVGRLLRPLRSLLRPRRPRLPGAGRRRSQLRTEAPIATAGAVVLIRATARDDTLSIVSRIAAAVESTEATQVILRVPGSARALRNPVAWPHIAAAAKRQGAALGVVSSHGGVRNHARENGLRVAYTVRGVRRPPHHRLRLGSRVFYLPRAPLGFLFRAAVLAAASYGLVILGCTVIPSAEIVIEPATTEIVRTVRVRLNSGIENPDVDLGHAPAVNFRHTFTVALATITTEEADRPDERAAAALRFSNPGDSEVVVDAGQLVEDEDGVTFATDETLTVAAGSSARVSATAVFPGSASNVGAGTLTEADDLPEGVTVTNPDPATGGTERTVPVVGQEDIVRIQAIARAVLRRQGEREVLEAIGGDTAVPETLAVAQLSQRPQSNLHDPAEVLVVDLTAIATVLALTQEEATRYGAALLGSELSSGLELLPGSTEVTVSDPRVEGGTVTVRLAARGLAARPPDTALLGEAVAGMEPEEAGREVQRRLDLAGTPTINLSPPYVPWRWLPRNPDRISVTLVGPAGEGRESGEGQPTDQESPDDTDSSEDDEPASDASGTATP